MTFLAQVLAALAIGILRYLQQREDLKAALRSELEKESLAYANKALEWKVRAAGDPRDAAYLRVQYPDKILGVQSDRAAPDLPPPQ